MYAPTRNRVMFVDDEEAVRLSWNRYLTQNGYDVVTAENGNRAVRELNTKDVDVVISDLRMPGLDGLDLLAWVHDQKPQTKFILLTGYGNDVVEKRARELGVFEFLNKPISPEALSAVITGALQLEKAAAVEAAKPAADAVPLELTVPAAPRAKPAAKTFLQTVGGLVLAPILGLGFVLFLPVIGFALLFRVALEALGKKSAAART